MRRGRLDFFEVVTFASAVLALALFAYVMYIAVT